LTRELAELQENNGFISELGQQVDEIKELYTLAQQESDAELMASVEESLGDVESRIERKEKEMSFSGPHDKSGAIITIQAGVGGTDAMDWAQMLERMYLRLAEAKSWKAVVLDRSLGEEAGIKHSTVEINGKMVYGILRGEHGVHRLVRQSPFNADKLRQTSFARVEVLPVLEAKEMPEIDAGDLKIDTYRAGGAGGQHVNKTDSAVRITHLPTGIVVQCQNERSQAQNKAHAMTVLQAKLQVLAEEQETKEVKELKGEHKEAAWGNQIRSYVLHPYKMVKDHRSNVERSDVEKILDGNLDGFVPDV